MERGAREKVGEGVGGSLSVVIPAGGKSIPLGGRVDDLEDPEEAFTFVAHHHDASRR